MKHRMLNQDSRQGFNLTVYLPAVPTFNIIDIMYVAKSEYFQGLFQKSKWGERHK